MYFTLILAIAAGLILLGMTRFTESVLEIRQTRREQADDPRAYL